MPILQDFIWQAKKNLSAIKEKQSKGFLLSVTVKNYINPRGAFKDEDYKGGLDNDVWLDSNM